MARSKKERIGVLRRYTFRLDLEPEQETACLAHCKWIARVWNACLQRNEDAYRRLATARHEMWWKPYEAPRKRRDGTLIEGRYVRRHLAHADRLHADPAARKLLPEERLVVFGTAKTRLTLFDFTSLPHPGAPASEMALLRRELLAQMAEETPNLEPVAGISLNRTAKLLEEAFNAFFKRAGAGGGERSGYPRYKRTAEADMLPLAFSSGSRIAASARERKPGAQIRRWRLTVKGIPGAIVAHGRLPATPLRWLDAEIRRRHGVWWLSIAVEVPPRREPGEAAVTVRLDLVDTFATVEGLTGPAAIPPSWGDIEELQSSADDLKAERDRRWPFVPGQALSRRRRLARMRMDARIARLSARAARMRRERLHEWTTAVQRQVADLTIIAPKVKDSTRSAKGSESNHGAAVGTVAALNRHVLSQAPASAIAMLKYKAEEAGARVDVVEDEAPPVEIGAALKKAAKAVRKARSKLRKEEEHV